MVDEGVGAGVVGPVGDGVDPALGVVVVAVAVAAVRQRGGALEGELGQRRNEGRGRLLLRRQHLVLGDDLDAVAGGLLLLPRVVDPDRGKAGFERG